MKGMLVGAISALSLLVGCGGKQSFDGPALTKALQKQNVKNLAPQKILSPDEVLALQEKTGALQDKDVDNWFTKDPGLDNAEGVSADKAYKQLHLKNQKQIVVAVIDGGVDITHEDLQGKIWINKNEIAANGIDDDKNGYIDDVYGWNFIGGHDAQGNNVDIDYEQLEVTREVVRYKKRIAAGEMLNDQDQAYFDKISKVVADGLADATATLAFVTGAITDLQSNYNILKANLNIPFEQMDVDTVTALKIASGDQAKAQKSILDLFKMSDAKDVAKFLSAQTEYSVEAQYYYNENYEPRKSVVGDDPDDLSQTQYGNNDITGHDASHGTHVSGIIAANRDNGIGIEGVAENVKIMVVRVVPNGDERDKDVALAIRYAADNGANVINMSFGKAYSPQKSFVAQAFQYAQSKNVLMVHAAGNEANDNDIIENYPTRGNIQSWLEVGASSQYYNHELTASFSNYGLKTVDLFAPGVDILSTIPKNQYAVYSGTSMASPSAAGVAALVWSQFPNVTAMQLKARLMATIRSRKGLLVQLPNASDEAVPDVPFETLSITGGIVDAFAAISAH